jgi:hypothetical protein
MYNLYTYEKQERDRIEKVLNQQLEKQKEIHKSNQLLKKKPLMNSSNQTTKIE